jgi:hypothetical protein
MIHEPTNDKERAFYSALLVLLNNRDSQSISTEQFLTLSRAVPEYALRMIEGNRTDLMYIVGHRRSPIAQMIMTAEWDLKGPSQFIEDHHLGAETEYSDFMQQRLTTNPEEFSPANLESIIRHFKPATPIHQAAVTALTNYVATFADRLTAEPPGLSDDVESLKQAIRDYGFSGDLDEVLAKIDDDLQKSKDAFDQTATMKHIRSFFEKLHESIARELQVKKQSVGNGTPLHQCGNAIDYLERKNVITAKIRDLGRCLYTILSDGDFGVHALRANRDYTRLCRNMVVEYAVTLFLELERRLAEPGDS